MNVTRGLNSAEVHDVQTGSLMLVKGIRVQLPQSSDSDVLHSIAWQLAPTFTYKECCTEIAFVELLEREAEKANVQLQVVKRRLRKWVSCMISTRQQ